MKTDSRIVITADGSHSVYNEQVGQHYHSIFGARQESERVFIELGLDEAFRRFSGSVAVFEMGFGTGLNALLTAKIAEKQQRKISYTAIEAFPLTAEEAMELNFDEVLETHYLQALHRAEWEQPTQIHPFFSLTKHHGLLQDWQTDQCFQLVYFDAFAPEAQPELWTVDVFLKMASLLQPGAILTTYCSKGYVQRNLKAAGFWVEKHPGPARKREVIRAIKT